MCTGSTNSQEECFILLQAVLLYSFCGRQPLLSRHSGRELLDCRGFTGIRQGYKEYGLYMRIDVYTYIYIYSIYIYIYIHLYFSSGFYEVAGLRVLSRDPSQSPLILESSLDMHETIGLSPGEYSRLQKVGTWMKDDVCWLSFFLWFGIGGGTCSNFLASTVGRSS